MNLKTCQSVTEHLGKKISNGGYPAGTALPSVRELASLYGVSPQTVSKALSALAEEGYVKTRRGSGSIVIYNNENILQRSVCMLVDSERNHVLTDREDPASYHSKDIYLSYLLYMNKRSLPSQIFVYEKDAVVCDESLCNKLESVDSILVQGTLPECYFKFLENKKIPVALINREIPEYVKNGFWGSIRMGLSGINEAVNYLWSLGHEKILFPEPLYLTDHRVLKKRYEQVLNDAGTAFGKRDYSLEIFQFTDDFRENLKVLESFIAKGFTASIGFNDVAALELSQMLNALEVGVPKDFSLIGFDDIFAAHLSSPPLSTIKVPRNHMVERAFNMLEQLSGERKKNTDGLRLSEEIECTFIIRGSSYLRK